MRILITGGAGSIGSHLSERLLRDGHTLTIVDDLNDFYSPAVKRANLEAVLRTGRAEKPDVIIHLAARAGVRPSLENPLLYQQVNVRGTMVLRWRWPGRSAYPSSSLPLPVLSMASPIACHSPRTMP